MMINSISSINSNSNNRQSFGKVIPPTQEFTDFLEKDVFKGNTNVITMWNKVLKRLTNFQANNPLCDITFEIGNNPVRIDKPQPVVHVTLKDQFIPKEEFSPLDNEGGILGFFKAVIKANSYANGLVSAVKASKG